MAEQRAIMVPATDRAFLYGDGLFETLLIINGVPLWPDLHFDRLLRGAKCLRIEVALTDVRVAISKALKACHSAAGVLRLTVSRKEGPRGYAPCNGVGARITAVYSDLGREPFLALPPAVVMTSSICMAEQPLLAGLKHCNRLEQVLAAAEARDLGVDDVLLCRSDGAYQCSSNANVFILHKGILLTPDCRKSGVMGTRRRLILERLTKKLGLPTQETVLTAMHLKTADAMFICNSIMGIRRVARWDERSYEPSLQLEQLQLAYEQEAKMCCAL